MCMIIDTNRWADFVRARATGDENLCFIHDWLNNPNFKGKICYTNYGKFGSEIRKAQRAFGRMLVEYSRIGALKQCSEEKYKTAENKTRHWSIESDDRHILTLAEAEDVKILHTEDKALMRDFKKHIGGTIYRYKKQAKRDNLLTQDTCP